tara:strand:+ start:470 stop:706 length:237 start_codon:yes stop_codon:yes gene_type:complete
MIEFAAFLFMVVVVGTVGFNLGKITNINSEPGVEDYTYTVCVACKSRAKLSVLAPSQGHYPSLAPEAPIGGNKIGFAP